MKTDAEIVKALECCAENSASRHFILTYRGTPLSLLLKDALNLINRQDEELNRLQAENERLKEQFHYLDIECERLEKENEIVKSEAYKECIEKVKSEIDSQSHSRSLEASGERFRIHKILDNLLKELVGGIDV